MTVTASDGINVTNQVLTVNVTDVSDAAVSIDGSGNLVVAGEANNNNLSMSINGSGQLVLTLAGGTLVTSLGSGSGSTVTIPLPLAGFTTNTINYNADGGTDNLTLDTSVIAAGLKVNYDGGSGIGDSMTLQGSNFNGQAATYTMTNPGTGSGNILLGASGSPQISFTNLAPLIATISSSNVTFNLPNSTPGNTVTFDSPTTTTLRLTDTDATPTFEQTTFNIPTGNLTINEGTGNDAMSVANNVITNLTAAGSGFGGTLSLNGQGGNDSFIITETAAGTNGLNLSIDGGTGNNTLAATDNTLSVNNPSGTATRSS